MDEKKAFLLGQETIGKLIWKMSIPSSIGILSYNLYNIIDTIYISRGIGAFAAGGLAVTFPLFILLSAVSNTIGAGSASVISRALGSKDIEKASRTAANAFLSFWLTALFITVIGLVFLDELLYAMGVTEKLLPYAREYTGIILLGAITSTGFSCLMRAEGNSRYAMYQWVIPVAANTILDPVFIFIFHMGIRGAAAATVISQGISVIMSMYYFFFSGKTQLQIKPKHFLPDIRFLGEIMSIGLPSFIQLMGSSITIIFINNALRRYGSDLSISTYGIVNRITAFLQIPLQGILQGVQPIIGYNYGAGEGMRVKETLKKASVLAAVYGLLVSLLLLAIPGQLMFLFSPDIEFIRIGSRILRITGLGAAFTSVYMIQVAFFQSIGKTRISLMLSILRYTVLYIPVIMLMSAYFGLIGVWYSLPLSAIISVGISSVCIIFRGDNKRYERERIM